jgi:predicted ATP-grasp superfamily ATP-dependent carboligase
VNPRYTASIEILEVAHGRSLLNPIAVRPNKSCRPSRVIVKRVLYADRHLNAPDISRFMNTNDPWRLPMVADIPIPGSYIEPGWPICTILAEGENEQLAEALIRSRAEEIRAAIAKCSYRQSPDNTKAAQ